MDGSEAHINLAHLRHNISVLQSLSGGRPICLAVKADGYGHGGVRIAAEAADAGVSHFGLARLAEGRQLRDAGITHRLLLYTAADPSDSSELAELEIEPFISDQAMLQDMIKALKPGEKLGVHLVLDSGMGRIGTGAQELYSTAQWARDKAEIEIRGIATHFPLSDDPSDTLTSDQLNQLGSLKNRLVQSGVDFGLCHASNSGALLFHRDEVCNLLRPGIAAYGYPPDIAFAHELEKRNIYLKPVMSLKSRVSYVKKVSKGSGISYGHAWHAPQDSWIATINTGYADGYPRRASGKCRVRIDGRDYQQVGRVCMDQMMVNLGPSPQGVKAGQIATVFGPDGAQSAAGIADAAETISYEITCGINARVPRMYHH